MKREKVLGLFLFFCLSLFCFTIAEEPLQMSLVSEEEAIQPGRPFWVAVRLKMANHWHAYWKNPGDAGVAPSIAWELPPGMAAGEIEWPYPERFDLDSLIGYGYEGEVWLLTKMRPPNSLNAPVILKAHVKALVCSDTTCLPQEGDLSLSFPVSQTAPLPRKEWQTAFEKTRLKLPKEGTLQIKTAGELIQVKLAHPVQEAHFFPENPASDSKADVTEKGYIVTWAKEPEATHLKGVLLLTHSEGKEAIAVDLPLAKGGEPIAMAETLEKEVPSRFEGFALALLLAFIGGTILNLMPCVLPVMSFKILSFVKMAGERRTKILQHGFAFALGVVVSFWVLAGMLLLLQAYGHSVGWGFQLQEPLFIALLAALLLAFGLSLFGVFEIGTSVVGVASEAEGRASGLFGSFLSGVLATSLATPCTGPFLGTAVGLAMTLPALFSLAIFTSIGLGMAAPYVALTAFPSLLRFMPKPGGWMVTFKELMGFLMIGSVLWLTWVFGSQTSEISLFKLFCALFLVAFGCWIYGKGGHSINTRGVRIVALSAVLFASVAAGYLMLQASYPKSSAHELASEWEPFSEARIAELQQQGIPVFVDFTAKWCLICQANHLIFSAREVKEAFDTHGVVKMKADWTKGDPEITAALKKFGRNSVPLYLFYGTDPATAPQILPQMLTPEIVLNGLRSQLIAQDERSSTDERSTK